jgi:hypothetical protein
MYTFPSSQLFGALERAVSWHGAAITLITADKTAGAESDWLSHLR